MKRYSTFQMALAFLTAMVVLMASSPAIARQSLEMKLKSLRNNYRYRMDQEEYHLAIDIAMRIHQLAPDEGMAAVNVARVFSTIGDAPRALEWLDVALEEGFSATEALREDIALINVSIDPAFVGILERSEQARLKQFERIKEEFEKTQPFTFIPPTAGQGEPMPLIIALHGFGVDSTDIADAWVNVAINRGAVLVAPNAPREGGNGFSWRYPDESEWIIMRTYDRTIADQNIDTSRIIITGFSQGGTLAYDLAMKYPHLFLGSIPIAGHYRNEPEAQDDLEREEWPRFFFMVGDNDRFKMNSDTISSQTKNLGYVVEYKVFKNTGHSLPDDYETDLFRAVDFIFAK